MTTYTTTKTDILARLTADRAAASAILTLSEGDEGYAAQVAKYNAACRAAQARYDADYPIADMAERRAPRRHTMATMESREDRQGRMIDRGEEN